MAGQLWLWGRNSNGQIGDNTTADKSSPIQTIAFGNNWVLSSYSSSLLTKSAIKTDGTLWLWGANFFGQLGDNTDTDKSSPIQTISAGNNWMQVSNGSDYYTAAIKADGTLWLWGDNSFGNLGDNSTVRKSSPIQVCGGGNNWSQVYCGYGLNTAAIKTDGTLWLWGRNFLGQIGDNSTTRRSSPVQIYGGGNSWSQVSCGDSHAAAIKTDGTLWSWGYNGYGQLGNNSTIWTSSPIQTIAGGTTWSAVSCGGNFTTAIKKDGTLWLWGRNEFGQLGDSSTTHKSSPVQTISTGSNWSYIAAGYRHITATKTDGTLWLWGRNYFGGLGDNTNADKSSPVQIYGGGGRWICPSFSYAIYENTANQLGINEQPQIGYNANEFLVQPSININDSNGAVVRIATNSVTVAVQSGTAVLSGTTTVNAVDGIATFTDLVLTGSGPVVLRFTSSGLTLVDSNTFTVSLILPIIPKKSEVTGRIPASGQLNIGELAINIEDKKGFIKKSDGTVLNIFNGKVADGGTF